MNIEMIGKPGDSEQASQQKWSLWATNITAVCAFISWGFCTSSVLAEPLSISLSRVYVLLAEPFQSLYLWKVKA